MNKLGASKTPYFFMVDFEMENVLVYEMDELDDIFFDVNGVKNHKIPYQENEIPLIKGRIPFMEYKAALVSIPKTFHTTIDFSKEKI